MNMMTLDRTIAPQAQPLSKILFPAIRTQHLSNGIPVHYVSFGGQDVLDLRVIFPAGKAFEKQLGVAGVAANMLLEGTAQHSGLQIAQMLDEYGSFIDHSSGFEAATFRLTTLGKHLGAVMPLFREVCQSPSFPEGELEKLLARQKQSLEVEEQKTSYIARREFNQLLFGAQHPYGRSLNSQDLDQISRAALVQFHQDQFDWSVANIVAVGGVDEAKVMALLEQHFGGMQMPGGYRGLEQAMSQGDWEKQSSDAGLHYFEKADSMQATVRVGHEAFHRNHPDYHPMQVVNTILGGYFGSRLMRNIREEKGFTYGIGSGWVAMRHSGLFIIQTDVGNEYIEPTLAEINKELELLMDKGVEEAELSLVKNYMVGKSVSGRELPSQIGETLSNAIINGLPFSALDEKFDRIMGVTTADIKTLAQKYFHPDQMIQVVSGKMGA